MGAPVVVVGAGFGGLAAAVELAARGEQVIVLEREQRAGGKARSVEVAGRPIDVGPTVLTMRWVFEELFARAKRRLEDAVGLTPQAVIARHAFADGSRLDLFADVERSADAIGAVAGPREARAYRRFAAYSAAIADTVREPFLRAERPSIASLVMGTGRLGLGALARIDAHRTMWRAIASFFDDERLRALFGRYATYVGSSPFSAPATLNLIAHVEREGVYAVEGGLSRLAAALADLALDLGVEVRYGVSARDVVVAGGRVTGVLAEHATGERELLAASAVVANADVSTIARGALGPVAASAVSVVPRASRSLSALTWAIDGVCRGYPLAHHTVFFSSDYRAESRALWAERRMPDEPTIYVCASDRASGRTPADGESERLFVIANAPANADGAPLSCEEVDRCERRMLAQLSRAGLEISPRASVVFTPTTFERRAPGTGGAIYGEACHGPFAPLSRPSSRTKLPGLYLAGGTVHPGPGVPMAALSGRTAARSVLADLTSTARLPRAVIAGSISTP